MALQRQRSQLLALEQGRHTRLNIPGLPSHRTRSTPPEGCTPWRIRISFSRCVSDCGDSTIDSGFFIRDRARLETYFLLLAAASNDCITSISGERKSSSQTTAIAPLSKALPTTKSSELSTISTLRSLTTWIALLQREKPWPCCSRSLQINNPGLLSRMRR